MLDKKYLNNDSVILHPVRNYKDGLISKFSHVIPDDTDWVLNIDSDEYLLINNKYKNIDELLGEALKRKPKLECFQFKWIWITNSIHAKSKSLQETIKKHDCYETKRVKSHYVFSIKTFQRYSKGLEFTCHCAKKNVNRYEKYAISEYYDGYKVPDKNLHVDRDTLGVIVHMRLRSLNNLIFKCVNIFQRSVPSKNAAMEDNKIINYLSKSKIGERDSEKVFMDLYNLNILDYEKRHISNVISRGGLILENYNNCISESSIELFDKSREEKYYMEWIKKHLSKKVTDEKLENVMYNIKSLNKILEDLKEVEKKDLNIFIL